MAPILGIPCQGERIHSGLFNLEKNQNHYHSNSRTGGLNIEGLAHKNETRNNEDFGI
ncbi:hypothetical protein L484_016078 [Morus notabilis]|uniref:Uncharacterized protein n=1 Tax=Morus notabilis TaxID=981085 RepID=W9SDL6_9ROSA|nr:hypothetical protein L484_016078 [Morus notabilis]